MHSCLHGGDIVAGVGNEERQFGLRFNEKLKVVVDKRQNSRRQMSAKKRVSKLLERYFTSVVILTSQKLSLHFSY